MKIYTDVNGNYPVRQDFLKSIILRGDFLDAWSAVCIYVLGVNLGPFHKAMMSFSLSSNNTSKFLTKSELLNHGYLITLKLRDPYMYIEVLNNNYSSKSYMDIINEIIEKNTILYEVFKNTKTKNLVSKHHNVIILDNIVNENYEESKNSYD